MAELVLMREHLCFQIMVIACAWDQTINTARCMKFTERSAQTNLRAGFFTRQSVLGQLLRGKDFFLPLQESD